MPSYADSAIDYVWEISQFNTSSGLLTVKYDPADSLDSARATQFQRFTLTTDQYDSATIIGLIEDRAKQVVTTWDVNLEKDEAADSGGITAPGVVGLTGSDRYKPYVEATVPVPFTNYNPLTIKVTSSDSEGADEIAQSFTTSAMSDSEKGAARNQVLISTKDLFTAIKNDAPVLLAFGFRSTTGSMIRAQTSFDGSTGGSFDWTTDKYDDFGVDSVTRTGTGTFEVTFSEPMPNGNYTVLTGAGDQDYGGAGASPRQVSVIARDSNKVTILCERTDDAVNEDNSYISMAVIGSYGDGTEIASFGEVTDKNFSLLGAKNIGFADSASIRVKTAKSMNDSDFAQFLIDNGASWQGYTV